MSKKRTTATDLDNIITEHFLYDRFRLLALNQHKWDGLPETIEERHIEKPLFTDGRACFFNDPVHGFMCLPCFPHGMNFYGEPTKYRAVGFGYQRELKAKDCVIIENNKLRMSTHKIVFYFVSQLYEVLRTRDVNIKTLKAPFIIKTDDKSVLTLKAVLDKIDNNEWAIFGDKSMGIDNAFEVFQTGVKCLTTELTDTYHDILNEALTYMGINNANTDKRERLITSEADANNQLIDSCAQMFLESRQRACEEINAKFGLTMSVELRTTREGSKLEEGNQNAVTND